MKQATMTFQVVVLNFHFCSTPTLKALTKNSKNNAPWIGPIALVRAGL